MEKKKSEKKKIRKRIRNRHRSYIAKMIVQSAQATSPYIITYLIFIPVCESVSYAQSRYMFFTFLYCFNDTCSCCFFFAFFFCFRPISALAKHSCVVGSGRHPLTHTHSHNTYIDDNIILYWVHLNESEETKDDRTTAVDRLGSCANNKFYQHARTGIEIRM